MAHALDKKAIAGLYNGWASPLDLPVPPGINGYSKTARGLTHDLAKAKRLLAESGVKLRKLTLVHMNNPRPYIHYPQAVARSVAASLAKIGITVTVTGMPWARYLAYVQHGKHQLCLLGWSTDNADADNFLSTLFHSSNTQKGRASNISFFKDDKLDRLLLQQRREVDPTKRAPLLDQVYRYVVAHSPIVPLIAARQGIVHHALLSGATLGPTYQRSLWRVKIRK